jgi:uncharacterized PurR-regulated membrane protein YhhQ (DUF165 family)
MKLIESFKRLSMSKKLLVVVLASPLLAVLTFLSLGLSTWLVSLFGLPIIGWAISRNSWRAGKRSSDKKVYLSFVLSLVATVTVLLVLRQPQYRTDWEGGNLLDDLIMLLWLATVIVLATTWYLAGWVGHRLLMGSKDRKSRAVIAPE